MTEEKIRSLTKIYYSNPKVQAALLEFSKDREVVPRYYEGFGKRPDSLQYVSDIMGLVLKGATSFHASEEIWHDPLKINSEMSSKELGDIRKSWDLLIDIDSPYIDYSKIAATLIIETLERYGIKNYGIKFSGSKGFHIIISGASFPAEFEGKETRLMFPEWPRAISEFLMREIRPKYNTIVTKQAINFKALEERTNKSKEELVETLCPNCGKPAKKGKVVTLKCSVCKTTVERPNPKITARKLKCTEDRCPGYFEVTSEKEAFFCDSCKFSSFSKTQSTAKKVVYERSATQSFSSDFKEQVSGEKIASLDLVLVAPRHLFRMPYSLHEKTSLASIVLTKEELMSFSPKDANPFKIEVRRFYPVGKQNEAAKLLEAAISWKKSQEEQESKKIDKTYEKISLKGVTEEMFPQPIKKLLKEGLKDGKKRGLFIIITFLRSLQFSREYISAKIKDWNALNDPPLKEGYIKSQLDWHMRQKKQILPPNYSNQSFYKDLGLLTSDPKAKNPLVEVVRRVRKQQISKQSF